MTTAKSLYEANKAAADEAKKEAYAALQKAADLYKKAVAWGNVAEQDKEEMEVLEEIAHHLEQVHEMERYVG